MATPFVKTLNVQGGTFYSFASPSKDISNTFNNENVKMVFSKFVALNLPDIATPSNLENYMQFNTIDGAIYAGLSSDVNVNFSQSFQNYALNLEELLLKRSSYNTSIRKSVSERIFFKWLKELGAIRFREANSTEKNSAITTPKYVEEDEILTGPEQYRRVVKYIGNIDVTNNVQSGGRAYSEVYINIPSENGSTPVILFDALSDDNYQEDMIISGVDEYIEGRDATDQHPEGLNFEAFYDYDNINSYSNSTNADWHGSSQTNSYYTEQGSFLDPSNTDITKDSADYPGTFSNVNYRRTNLDGISLDFEPTSYQGIVNNPSIASISEYNGIAEASDFEFNAVAVFYDVFNENDPNDRATNLWGILMLDNITPTIDGGYIERYKKFKQNPVTKLNGNSYGLRLNIRFDSSIDNTATETIVNDYNTFSMHAFGEAIAQLQENNAILLNDKAELIKVQQKLNELETYLYTQPIIDEIKGRLSILERNFNNSDTAIADKNAIFDLIENLSSQLTQILQGNVPLNLQYNTDVVVDGEGIFIDKSITNKIKVENTVKGYGSVNKVSLDLGFDNDNIIELQPFENYIRDTSGGGLLNDNLNIKLDDSGLKWSTGQVIRIVLPDVIDPQLFSLIVYTDAKDILNTGNPYSKVIGNLLPSEFSKNSSTIFEITCLDENTLDFVIDIIRN